MAKLKEVAVSLGITVEKKGTYYKPQIEIRLEMNEEDKGEARKKVLADAWKLVTDEVERQLSEIL